MTRCDISIIIPSKNGGRWIGKVLAAIAGQQTEHTYEIIVIDSGSTDATLDIVQRHPIRLYTIPPAEFSHSKTRNYGASLAAPTSRYLLFLNQDAIPWGRDWLNGMMRSIESEKDVRAACCMEIDDWIPFWPRVSGVSAYVFSNIWTRGIHIIEPHLVRKADPPSGVALRKSFPFTTVCAIFEKKYFLANPFNSSVAWGEDLHWAFDTSNRGDKAACASYARVIHRRRRSREELLENKIQCDRLYRAVFGADFTLH